MCSMSNSYSHENITARRLPDTFLPKMEAGERLRRDLRGPNRCESGRGDRRLEEKHQGCHSGGRAASLAEGDILWPASRRANLLEIELSSSLCCRSNEEGEQE